MEKLFRKSFFEKYTFVRLFLSEKSIFGSKKLETLFEGYKNKVLESKKSF